MMRILGKSTLLAGILGECKSNRPDPVELLGKISYAPQVPWIQQNTIKENIIFGSPFDVERLNYVNFSE